jgi:hypothetical protein
MPPKAWALFLEVLAIGIAPSGVKPYFRSTGRLPCDWIFFARQRSGGRGTISLETSETSSRSDSYDNDRATLPACK